MDHQGLYKNRPAPGQKSRNNRAQETQKRGRSNRADAYLQNRGISDDCDETPVKSPVAEHKQPLIMQSVNKKASTMNFTTRAEERMFKVQEMRKRQVTRETPAKRSPFVTAVPSGRILPRKHDVVEDYMNRFKERQAKVMSKPASTNKRRSIKRKSLGKPQLVVKKTGTRAVVVKAITRPKSVKKEPKSLAKVSAKKVPIILEPQPGTSQQTNVSLKMKPRTPNGFLAPTLKPVPKTKPKKTRQSFNICQSFITSTTSKRVSNAKLIPANEIPDEESFLEGISPIPDVTPFKFSGAKKSPRFSSGSKKSSASKGLPTPIMPVEPMLEQEEAPFVFVARKSAEKEPTIDDELNITFTQEDDEVVEEKDDVVVVEEKKRRSSIRKSLPVIPAPVVNERTTIAQGHTDTLESEIKRLTDRNAIWTAIRDENLLNDNVIGLINSAVGQSELLMRKKLPKFRELIDNYENDSGARAVLPDDLYGYWMTVMMEIGSIDKRFTELETLKTNDWEEKQEEEKKPKARKRRARKNDTETDKKTTVNLGLKEHIRKIREKFQRGPEKLPEMDTVEAENVKLTSVKRLAETPRKSVAKRRSLNCSGCCTTPTSARKSKSAKKMSALVTAEKDDSAAKAKRKSSKKINFVEVPESPPTAESVAHRSILKSTNKRNTKSVLFAAESPEKPVRAQKTPRKTKTIDISIDWNDENSPVSTYNTPISYTPTIKSGRKSRKATPKPKFSTAVSDFEDSPLSALPESRTRRSTRLFGNLN